MVIISVGFFVFSLFIFILYFLCMNFIFLREKDYEAIIISRWFGKIWVYFVRAILSNIILGFLFLLQYIQYFDSTTLLISFGVCWIIAHFMLYDQFLSPLIRSIQQFARNKRKVYLKALDRDRKAEEIEIEKFLKELKESGEKQ